MISSKRNGMDGDGDGGILEETADRRDRRFRRGYCRRQGMPEPDDMPTFAKEHIKKRERKFPTHPGIFHIFV